MSRSRTSLGRLGPVALVALVATARAALGNDAAPAPGGVDVLPEEVDRWATFAGQVIRMLAVLGAIAAVGWIVAKVVGPRFGLYAARPTDLIRVLETKRLDAKTTLYLVEVAGKTTLIGVSEGEVRSLAPLEIDEDRVRDALAVRDAAGAGTPAPGKPAKAPPASFAHVLSGKRKES